MFESRARAGQGAFGERPQFRGLESSPDRLPAIERGGPVNKRADERGEQNYRERVANQVETYESVARPPHVADERDYLFFRKMVNYE